MYRVAKPDRPAVLRLPGESTGADQDVAIAEEWDLPVYTRVQDIPRVGRG
jgi:hypothetical protein